MLGHSFEDPMRVPFWFADDADTAATMVAEWAVAGELTYDEEGMPSSPGLLAVDTETDYDPELNLNIEVAEERVVSAFAAFTTTDGVSDEALIVGDDVPPLLRDAGYVACKTYVLDVGYISASVLAPISEMLLYVWNMRFERKVFARMGIEAGFLFDLMLAQAALDQGAEGVRYYTGLARAAETYIGWNLEGKGGIQLSYRPTWALPELSHDQRAYAGQDAVATALLQTLIVPACKAVVVDFDDGRGELSLWHIAIFESGSSNFLDKMQVVGVPVTVDDDEVHIGGETVAGWLEFCEQSAAACAKALARIADIEHEIMGEHDGDAVSASQGLLSFDDVDDEPVFEPSFDPGSHKQMVEAMNRLVPDRVRKFTARHLGAKPPRLFVDADTVDKNVLKLMGGELAEAITTWSKHNKLAVDSGARFIEQWVNPTTGRLHPEIKQCLVNTGRLSMSNPPMQNRPPDLKRFHRATPGKVQRELEEMDDLTTPEAAELLEGTKVTLYADLSQAELRALAHMSRDERMTDAFVTGQDLHTLTATQMFELDIKTMMQAKELSDEDLLACALDNRVDVAWGHTTLEGDLGEDRHIANPDKTTQVVSRSKLVSQVLNDAKLGRGKAKVPNFGVAYGMAGPTLARTLCLQGVDTTASEGNEILERWLDTYQGVKTWLLDRDAYIEGLAKNPPPCDYDATWRLARWFKPVTDAKFSLKRRLDRFPTPREIAEHLHPEGQVSRELAEKLGHTPSDEEMSDEMQARAEFVRWVLSFRAPVVVAADGTPFAIASRTLGGRRRLFQVPTKLWVESQVQYLLRADPNRGSRQQKQIRKVIAERRAAFAQRHHVEAIEGTKPLGWRESRNALDKQLHQAFVTDVLAGLPAGAADHLGKVGLSDRIKAMRSQFRNAPIQGTVGDVMLYAYWLLDQRLKRFGDRIVPSLTVHDSIMLLSDIAVAREGARILQETMEEALEHFCPTLPAKADAAILWSFDESDVVDERLLIAAEQLLGDQLATAA